jgi:ribosome maturation factor RimP
MNLKNTIESLIKTDTFIVSVKEVTNQSLLKVVVDSERQITLNETTEMARALRDSNEINTLFPEGVRIEVSTPGISAPLIHNYQFKKNIGKKIRISLMDNCKSVKGVLASVKEKGIQLNSNNNRKNYYSFEEINEAFVQVSI